MIYSRTPYQPIMPRRKLKNLTLITEKNLGKVMGDLNRFFSNPTCKLSGFCKKEIGMELVVMPDGYQFLRDLYTEEEYPIYTIYEGTCKLHHTYKKYLEEGKIPFFSSLQEIPRIAICSKYDTNCVPIHIGDRYKLYGNRLIILHKWDKYVHHTPWMRYTEFIQVPKHDYREYMNGKIMGTICVMTADMAYLHETLE